MNVKSNKPGYRFPTLRVPLGKLCDVGYNPYIDFQRALIGLTYYFRSEAAVEAAKSFGLTLDQSLVFDVAKGFQAQPPRTPALVWFGCVSHGFYLWVCGNKATTRADWLIDCAGYAEVGQDYIRPNAVPLVYWDGQYAHRVYMADARLHKKSYWVQDFGSLVGATLSGTSRANYDSIKADPIQKNDYSAIPHETELVLRKGQSRVVLTQALLEFSDNPLEERE